MLKEERKNEPNNKKRGAFGFVVCIILECLVLLFTVMWFLEPVVKSFLKDGLDPVTLVGSFQNEKFQIGCNANKIFC